MTGEQAWRDYGLSASDLKGLPSMHRLGVVFDSSSVTRLFNKFEVQDAAIAKHCGRRDEILNRVLCQMGERVSLVENKERAVKPWEDELARHLFRHLTA